MEKKSNITRVVLVTACQKTEKFQRKAGPAVLDWLQVDISNNIESAAVYKKTAHKTSVL